jgi:hypothetical protein
MQGSRNSSSARSVVPALSGRTPSEDSPGSPSGNQYPAPVDPRYMQANAAATGHVSNVYSLVREYPSWLGASLKPQL